MQCGGNTDSERRPQLEAFVAGSPVIEACQVRGARKSRLGVVHTELPGFSMPSEKQANLAAESFQMLADATRVKLLWALLQGESSVTCLAELVGATPTAVSQHLAKLRLARLVMTRREGTFVYYSAADVHVRRLLDEALFHADHTDGSRPDHQDRGRTH